LWTALLRGLNQYVFQIGTAFVFNENQPTARQVTADFHELRAKCFGRRAKNRVFKPTWQADSMLVSNLCWSTAMSQ